jgi:AcrR family transcriptional regulator
MSNEPRKRPGSRATQKEATGKAVLEAARAEFERVGFDAANLRSIAARAGVSAGTVIHHHGDKRELLHAALFDDLDETLRRALSTLGPGTLEAQLSELTGGVFAYYQRRPKLSRTLLKESLFADAPWAGKFTAQAGLVHGAVARLAMEASARGELRPDVDAALFAAAYLSFFYFALISWVQGAHGAPVSLVEHLVHQHLEGLGSTKQSSRRKTR